MSDSVVIRGAGLLDVDAGALLPDRQLIVVDGESEPSCRLANRSPRGRGRSISTA